MSTKTIRPGLTAATRVGRELLAAGWVYDATTEVDGGAVERILLHPSGRQITATSSRDGDSTKLTMTGLSLEDVADAITAAGLTATAEAAPEHYHSGGTLGGPGDTAARCACGVVFSGFDSQAEALAVLNEHIANPVPAEATGPQTVQHKLAAELIRLARDIVRLDLPLKDTMCGELALGVLASRADLEKWAAYLGSTIDTGPANNIPVTQHRILLDGRPYGAWLTVRAQIRPDEPTEVERLRAEVAQLRAQVAGGEPR
ncbi:hypothetical protein ACFFMR_19050 [Micromonospora andamanensis]|uniref:Uncharacterized protein n=1 Tax=Micromonospora andamanensis TaxID=1287068 RepID=A0ABQ4HYU2_9ACTN|nr:hypothetical protein [Micromonospora andamanensis]GIJ10766.1 hypothetical protein Van01_39800 [Micromonospora andamanensis]